MKLWKSKKSLSCISSKTPVPLKSVDFQRDATVCVGGGAPSTIPLLPILSDRAMSPAQSEDSGLAPDRGTTYATIILPRNNDANMGITFVERNDLTLPPVVATLSLLGLAGDFLAPGDRIHQIDSLSTIGLTNAEVMNLLCQGNMNKENAKDKANEASSAAVVEIEYSLPESVSRSSLCVSTKLADIVIEREGGCLGLTLRGGGELPLIVTYIRPNGPVAKDGRVKAGDRLLRINNMSLVGKTLAEAQHIIKFGTHLPEPTSITIEYDVSVVQSVEFTLGPLLIEIERPMNGKLGLLLCSYPLNTVNEDQQHCDDIYEAGVFIESILPASIAERCGALSVGDQILSVDEMVIGHSDCTPNEVMALLASHNGRPYIQLQIMPVHALVRRGCSAGCSKYGFNTMECRKSRGPRQRFIRKSSLPLENCGNLNTFNGNELTAGLGGGQKKLSSTSTGASSESFQSVTTASIHHTMKKNICRDEIFSIMLDCSHKSGIILDTREQYRDDETTIIKIIPDSVADNCGCLQEGDRILAINNIYTLDVHAKQHLLDGKSISAINLNDNWLQLEVKFDMLDSVVPSSGVFTVKLKRAGKIGFGFTFRNGGTYGGVVITDVKPGSTAHRTGSLQVGDVVLAVDNHSVQNFNAEALLYGVVEGGEYTTLTVKRTRLPDFIFDAQQKLPTLTGTLDYNGAYDASTYANQAECGKFKASPPMDFLRESSLDSCNYMPSMLYCNTPNTNTWTSNADKPLPQLLDEETNVNEYESRKNMIRQLSSHPSAMDNSMYASTKNNAGNPNIFTVRLESKGGLHGIVLAGSDDGSPISISELVEGGSAYKNRQLKVGDQLLAINDESVKGMPLSYVTKLLQSHGDLVHLQVLRQPNMDARVSQNQALYAKVVRRVRSPFNTDTSATSSKDSNNKQHVFHVTLYKDKVYDDFGFSVSDGLYERGVFINRIRTGGSADLSNLLKPFDRIMQVNNMKTQDFDCCLTVPLIAAAGDKIELIIQRTE